MSIDPRYSDQNPEKEFNKWWDDYYLFYSDPEDAAKAVWFREEIKPFPISDTTLYNVARSLYKEFNGTEPQKHHISESTEKTVISILRSLVINNGRIEMGNLCTYLTVGPNPTVKVPIDYFPLNCLLKIIAPDGKISRLCSRCSMYVTEDGQPDPEFYSQKWIARFREKPEAKCDHTVIPVSPRCPTCKKPVQKTDISEARK